jgi:hypothetical protein
VSEKRSNNENRLCEHAFGRAFEPIFDRKLRRKVNDEQLLGTGDIQSLANLGNSFAVVREMRAVPFMTDDVVQLLVVTVIPLVPLLLTMMPLDQLITQAIKFIFGHCCTLCLVFDLRAATKILAAASLFPMDHLSVEAGALLPNLFCAARQCMES